jgi:hypothetical protein
LSDVGIEGDKVEWITIKVLWKELNGKPRRSRVAANGDKDQYKVSFPPAEEKNAEENVSNAEERPTSNDVLKTLLT